MKIILILSLTFLIGCSQKEIEKANSVLNIIHYVASLPTGEMVTVKKDPYEHCNHRVRPCVHTPKGQEVYPLEYIYPTSKLDILKLEAKLTELKLAILKEEARRKSLKPINTE